MAQDTDPGHADGFPENWSTANTKSARLMKLATDSALDKGMPHDIAAKIVVSASHRLTLPCDYLVKGADETVATPVVLHPPLQ